MIDRVLFHPKHLDLLNIKEEWKKTVLNLDRAKMILGNIPGGEAGDALTLVIDGRVIACFGYFLVFPGVVEVWLIPSIHIDKYSLTFVRIVRRYLDQTAALFQWHRIQTVTEMDGRHRKWMKVLGFKEEGILEKYFNHKDYVISARLFERG